MIDFILSLIVRFQGLIIRSLPLRFGLFIGGKIGGLGYYLAGRKRNVLAYENIKAALGDKLTPQQMKRILKNLYRNLGEGFVELLWMPKMDKKYLDKNIEVVGKEHLIQARQKNCGLVFLTAHFGHWEMLNLAAAVGGYPIKAIARQQKMRRLFNLLNSYREMKGCKVIFKDDAKKEILRALKNKEIVGILGDQSGGNRGIFIDFFGRAASTPAGAVAFGIRTNSLIMPVFIIRKAKGKHKIVLNPPLEIKDGENQTETITDGLNQYIKILEKFITDYPDQWLWLHRRWKSTPVRNVLILSDGKAGHLNQSLAVERCLQEAIKDKKVYNRPLQVRKKIVEIKYKSRFNKTLLAACALFSGSGCTGCTRCLRFCLKKESYDELVKTHADLIISCGSSTQAPAIIYSKETNAKTVALMKPGIFSTKRFNLVMAPRHDGLNNKKNVLVTRLAPNLIDQRSTSEMAEKLKVISQNEKLRIGLLLGGDSDGYKLPDESVKNVLQGICDISDKLNADILATTSRRTSREAELLTKDILGESKNCKLLVIANEKNIDGAVPGILGLSDVVIVSGESVSMVSEAVTSGKEVLVFELPDKQKHKKIIQGLQADGFLKIIQADKAGEEIAKIWSNRSGKHPSAGTISCKIRDKELITQRLKDFDF